MGQLDGRVIIVTGAGRGIGRASAIAYGREGAKVAVASRTQATVEEVAQQIVDEGGEAIGLTCDVGHREEVFEMVERTVEEFGTVDVLVNNAQSFGTEDNPRGSSCFIAVEDTDEEELEYTFRTGALSTVWGMKAVFPHMKERGGKVINMASASGMVGFPGITAYNMTKEAVRSLTRTAAKEWAKHQITVNVICPALKTDAFTVFEDTRPEFAKQLVDSIPLGRFGDPMEDGAPLMVFLAGRGADYITGMTFMLNGGRDIFH